MAHDAALPIFTGHRIGTAEVESALVLNNKCAEAAVVGYEHPIKGQGIYAYVTLMDQVDPEDSVKKELVQCAAPRSLPLRPCCCLCCMLCCCAAVVPALCSGRRYCRDQCCRRSCSVHGFGRIQLQVRITHGIACTC